MPALPFAARSEGADRDREAPGVRSSRAPAAGDGASGFGLPLRALPARDQGGVSRRKGTLGRTHARDAARGQRGGARGAGSRKAGAPDRAGQGLRRSLLGGGPDGPGVSSWAARVGDEVEDSRTPQTTSRPQSARQAEEVQNRNAAFPHRLRRALHQQPRRTRSADDEGQDEDLRRLPDPRGRADFRAPQVRRVDREEAGFQHSASPHRDPRAAHAISRRLIVGRSHARSSATRRRVRRDGTRPHRKRRCRAFGTDPETACRWADTEQQRTPIPNTSNLRNLAAASRAAPHGQGPAVAGPPTHRPPPTAPGLGVTKGQKKAPYTLKSLDAGLKSAPVADRLLE